MIQSYDILYWEGKITLIDFPQIVQLWTNDDAKFILSRDITRIYQYFNKHGVRCDAQANLGAIFYRRMESDSDWQADEISRVMSAELDAEWDEDGDFDE